MSRPNFESLSRFASRLATQSIKIKGFAKYGKIGFCNCSTHFTEKILGWKYYHILPTQLAMYMRMSVWSHEYHLD